MMDNHPLLSRLSIQDLRLFRLNMTKLNELIPRMLLTVEERQVLSEILLAYFGKEPPPPLPWRDKVGAVAQRMAELRIKGDVTE